MHVFVPSIFDNLASAAYSPQWLPQIVMTRPQPCNPQMTEQALEPCSKANSLNNLWINSQSSGEDAFFCAINLLQSYKRRIFPPMASTSCLDLAWTLQSPDDRACTWTMRQIRLSCLTFQQASFLFRAIYLINCYLQPHFCAKHFNSNAQNGPFEKEERVKIRNCSES